MKKPTNAASMQKVSPISIQAPALAHHGPPADKGNWL